MAEAGRSAQCRRCTAAGQARQNRPRRRTSARLAAIDARIAAIDNRLPRDFPDYAALVSPKPLSIADVQAELGDDEALVLFLDTPESEADAGGDLHLGGDQDGQPLGAHRPRHEGILTEKVQALRAAALGRGGVVRH